ncbi:hypothetical protein PVNG_02143 [Plasmodium vivax North Korean]|uniref:Uncharacterized protein n=1 Tax=Plasmodium vivax North Korean TaxID=1035514 RepID=A0A0J9TTJ3_PLAVI|nr:hypothetical protein PVNG_02143 [Plasmodium vivax North Korean]
MNVTTNPMVIINENIILYKFLEEILNLYDILDKPLVEKGQNEEHFNLCNSFPWLKGDNEGEYNKFCKKLLNNLLLLSNSNYGDGNFFKYCDILYMWMYFEIKEKDIPNEITKKSFNESSQMIISTLRKTPCPYLNFNEKHEEPTKLMKLRIFQHNISIFQNTLNDKKALNNCSCLKYIYECINIYKEMNSKYCLRGKVLKPHYDDTCDILHNFNINYSNYIHNKYGSTYDLPSLSGDIPIPHIIGCPLDEKDQGLSSNNDNQSDNSIFLYVPKVLGTMAGVSSLLALLYKVMQIFIKIYAKYCIIMNKIYLHNKSSL